jgi:hypothetical protein
MRTRTVRRPRRYVAGRWLALLTPILRYSSSREAYILRGIGRRTGPVLREERRRTPQPPVAHRERRRARPA